MVLKNRPARRSAAKAKVKRAASGQSAATQRSAELELRMMIDKFAPDQLVGSQTGVFIGVSSNDYGQVMLKRPGSNNLDGYGATGTALNAVAGRWSYTLGLNGPGM
ncbi:hypothetical protein B4Q13_21965, partial [Lacticaseibacillus rhamnosus]